MKYLVTGGAGFIGSALCRLLIGEGEAAVVNVDKLTYAADPRSLAAIEASADYAFVKADICDREAMDAVFARHDPDGVIHLAAESHVDRSITGAEAFVRTNVVGTFTLLEAARAHLDGVGRAKAAHFRFLHVSTDEVFGSLGPDGHFVETTPYAPTSPYSASKAASDHLARAWLHTYGLPVIVSNCSNNYGPHQFPEKLIPLMTIKAMAGEPLPIYGSGLNVRDWLHVDDHARALLTIIRRGAPGRSYNIGGHNERSNLDVVGRICDLLDAEDPRETPRRALITHVADRPGHDARYAIDASLIERELGWRPRETFESGLARTVRWYRDNEDWWRPLMADRYGGERLGLPAGARTS